MKNQFYTFVSSFQTFWWPIPCQVTRMVIFRGFLYLLFGFVSSWGWKNISFGVIVSSKNESDQIVSICIALVAHPWLSFQSDYAQNSISILKTTLFLLLSPGVANELLAWKSLTVIARIMFVINYYFWLQQYFMSQLIVAELTTTLKPLSLNCWTNHCLVCERNLHSCVDVSHKIHNLNQHYTVHWDLTSENQNSVNLRFYIKGYDL